MAAPMFCIAPWINSYRGTDGFRSLCCLTTTLQKDSPSFAEWWNGEEIRRARRTLLRGEIPPECSPCVESNRVSGGGSNVGFMTRFADHIPEILATTDGDGRTDFKPRAIDYRTIHCNLRCRTCDARNSSSIRAETARAGDWLPPQASTVDGDWWKDDGTLESVGEVYWAGGEPLMSPIHDHVMRTLLLSGRASEVKVQYTSNLMHLNDRLVDDLTRFSEGFRSVIIGASIDGVGDIGAYIRTGWNHDRFFSNLDLLRAQAPRLHIYLDLTLTNLGLLSFPDLLEAAACRDIHLYVKMMERNAVNDFLHLGFVDETLVAAVMHAVNQRKLPARYWQVVEGVEELLARRYTPCVFGPEHEQMVERSEARRGMKGFFFRLLGPHLNVVPPP